VTLFVLLVVVVPLLGGTGLVERVSARSPDPTAAELEHALGAVRDRSTLVRGRAADQAELLAQRNAAARVTADDPSEAQAWLTEQFDDAAAARGLVACTDLRRRQHLNSGE
jgi:hypothetical protein